MPFYDINRATTSNGSANTETSHLWVVTVANQETLSLMGVYAAARFATAGGGQLNTKFNTGTIASGGTAQTPQPKNLRSAPAAQSTWKNDATAITAGTTLTLKSTVGFAQTGGMGGWVPVVPGDAPQLMPNGANPIDMEWTSNMATASVTFNMTVEFMEGTN
jgi:hypothetical protein